MKTKKALIPSEFLLDSYKNIGVDHLVIYSARKILDNLEECTFERLVCECFRLFPKKFSFQRYPNWPDATRINKAWLRCRTDKGWLAGTVKEGFRITTAGEEIARNTENLLKNKNILRRNLPAPKPRERYEAVVLHIKNAPEYKKYVNIAEYEINETDLRSFLGGTLETPKRILRHNLNLYMNAAVLYNEQSVIPYLQICKNKLEKLGG
jgi:hypothetical protein